MIKTGLRKINTSYSRISFEDISAKLSLESTEDTEFIVAKAIKDGVIDATINHQEQYIQSKDTYDIYSTQEPQMAFHRRMPQAAASQTACDGSESIKQLM